MKEIKLVRREETIREEKRRGRGRKGKRKGGLWRTGEISIRMKELARLEFF